MLKFTSSNSTDGPSSPGSSKLAVSGAMLLPVMTLEHSWLPHKMTNFEVKKTWNVMVWLHFSRQTLDGWEILQLVDGLSRY